MKPTKPLLCTAAILLAANGTAQAQANDDLLFNFGPSAITGINYNNIDDTSVSVNNAIDSSGNATTLDLAVTGWNQANGSAGSSGTTAPTGAASVFNSAATQTYIYGQSSDADGGLITLMLTGLNDDASYSFTFFNSRTGVTDDRDTQFQVVGASTSSIDLNAANNTSNVAVDSDVTPDNGDITINITAASDNNNASKFFYINAMEIDVEPTPEPSSAAMLSLGGVGIMLMGRRFRRD